MAKPSQPGQQLYKHQGASIGLLIDMGGAYVHDILMHISLRLVKQRFAEWEQNTYAEYRSDYSLDK
jgi:hypothetical protein